jgi:hypothetical protein
MAPPVRERGRGEELRSPELAIGEPTGEAERTSMTTSSS